MRRWRGAGRARCGQRAAQQWGLQKRVGWLLTEGRFAGCGWRSRAVVQCCKARLPSQCSAYAVFGVYCMNGMLACEVGGCPALSAVGKDPSSLPPSSPQATALPPLPALPGPSSTHTTSTQPTRPPGCSTQGTRHAAPADVPLQDSPCPPRLNVPL